MSMSEQNEEQESKEMLLPRGRLNSSIKPNYQFYGDYKMEKKVYILNPIQTIAENEVNHLNYSQKFELIADELLERGYTHCRLVGREGKDYYLAYTIGFFQRLLQCPYPQEILHDFISFVTKNQRGYFTHSKNFFTKEIEKRIIGHFVDIVEVVKMIQRRTTESYNPHQVKNSLIYFYKMITYSKVLLNDMIKMLRNMAGNFIRQKPWFQILPDTVISALILPAAIDNEEIRTSVERNPMAEKPKKHFTVPEFIKEEVLNMNTSPHLIVQAVLCKILGFHLRLLEYKFNHYTLKLKQTISMETDQEIALFTRQRVIELIRLDLLSFNQEYYILYRSEDEVELLTWCQIKSKSTSEGIESVVDTKQRDSMLEQISLNCGVCCGRVIRKIMWNYLEEYFPLLEEHQHFEERFFIFDQDNPRRATCQKGQKLTFKALQTIFPHQDMNRKRFTELEKRFDQQFPIVFSDFKPSVSQRTKDRMSSTAKVTGTINEPNQNMTRVYYHPTEPKSRESSVDEITRLSSGQQERRYCRGSVNRCQMITFSVIIVVVVILIVFFLLNEFKILPKR